ncbi:MAG: sensor histidine kinase [Bacteroidetes bacterium]|nr:sensor histidine kinase [Bacteroidota bacterium]
MEGSNPFFFLLAVGTAGMLVMAAAIVVFILYYQKRMLHEKLKQNQMEIDLQEKALRMTLESQENERKRIAKDLHDGVQAMMQALRVTVLTVIRDSSEQDKKEIQEMVNELTETVRAVSWDLMPSTLERFGLVSSVEEFCKRLNGKVAMPVYFTQHGSPLALDMNQQLLLYRIMQESVNNAIKHAKASKIEVTVNWQEGLHLTVADDGVGFDFSPELKFKNSSGLGLSNLESRARLLHAELKFLKNTPSGCVVDVFLPISVNGRDSNRT